MQGQQQKQNWVTHPTKRNLFIVLIAWMVANGLLMILITDLFRETFFNKRYVLIYALMLMSTWTMAKAISNYLKSNV